MKRKRLNYHLMINQNHNNNNDDDDDDYCQIQFIIA